MTNLKAAVIGTGFIGPVHIEGLRRAGVHVAGVLGSTSDKSKLAAEKLQLDQAYSSLDQLLSDSEVDVVHITSPNQHHFQQAKLALAAGKHVLCEKPLAMNTQESAELVNLANQADLAAGVNYNIRYYPLCLEAATQVREGTVGELFHVTGSYSQDWLFHPTDFNWRVCAQEGGELRAVADIGTHWLDLIQHVTGRRVVAVCADLHTVHPQRQRPTGSVETYSAKTNTPPATEAIDVSTEDYGGIMLRFHDQSRGMIWVSQVSAGHKNRLCFEIAGSKQSLAWNSERPNELSIGQRDSANQLLIRDPALMGPRAANASSYPGGHNEGFGDTFKQLFTDFYGSIESGEYRQAPSYPTFADGHHEIQVCEAILESHQQQRWIKIGESKS